MSDCKSWDKYTGRRVKAGSGSGGGGGDLYSNSNPTPEDVGGIPAGSTFTNQTMQQMWDALLYPYQYPAFTSFTIDRPTTVEVGDNLGNSFKADWTTSNSGNVQPNTIKIEDLTAGETGVIDSANDGTENFTQSADVTHNTPTNHTWRISAQNTKGDTFSRNYTVHFYYRMFYGESNDTTLDENGVESLRANLLSNTFARTYHFQAGGYKYIAYPTAWGEATEFKDADTGFAVAMETPYVITITNANGVSYDVRVHRTTNVINSELNMIVS